MDHQHECHYSVGIMISVMEHPLPRTWLESMRRLVSVILVMVSLAVYPCDHSCSVGWKWQGNILDCMRTCM